MNFKKVMTPICTAVSLAILFIILHLALIGPIPVTSICVDGWNTRIISREEMDAGLKDFSYYGDYIRSETGNPWILFDNINDNKNLRFLYIDIEDLSEYSSTLQVYLTKGEQKISNYYNLYQGENIICLEWNDYESIRIDLTNKCGIYFLINEIKFTDNYLLAIPSWFWCIYLLSSAVLIIILILFTKEKLPKTDDNRDKSAYWSEFWGGILNALCEHKIAFIVGSILIILIFGFEITNFTLGIDEEREIVHACGTMQNINSLDLGGGQGRYSTTILKHLLSTDGVFTPYVDTLISVLGITAAAITNIISFEKCSRKRFKTISCIIFMGLFCSLPYVVTEWMCFSTINAEVSIGIFLMSLAIYTICVYSFSDGLRSRYKEKAHYKDKYAWLIFSSLLCAFNIAIYECLAPYFMLSAVLCVLFYIIYDYETGFKQFFIKAVPFIISFLIGFAIYEIIKAIVGTNGYTDKFIQWGKISISEILNQYAKTLDNIFNVVLPGSFLSAVSVLCFAILLMLIGLRQKRIERFFLMLFGGLCCFIVTFALNIVIGGPTTYRTMIPLMLLTSAPWIIAIEYLASYKFIKVVPVFLSAFILLHQAVYVNKVFTGAHLASQLDMEWGYNIGQSVVSLCPDSYSEKPLVIVGRHWHYSPVIVHIDAVGRPNSYMNGNIIWLLRYLGFVFIPGDNFDQARAEIYAQDMPTYPEEGSIQEFDDMIVVRLS